MALGSSALVFVSPEDFVPWNSFTDNHSMEHRDQFSFHKDRKATLNDWHAGWVVSKHE